MRQSLSNTIKSLQAVRIAALLKKKKPLLFLSQLFVDPLENRCSWIIHKILRKAPVFESLFKYCLETDIHKMFFKMIIFKKFCKFHRKATVLESSLIKLQVLRTAALLKRDSNTGFLLWILWIIQKHLFCVEDLWTAGSETPVCLFKNTFFTEHLQWLVLAVSGFQPAALLKKELLQRRFSVIFANF